ncbi:carotenoid biosynthesis protein [Catellatospora coxensis]|uniref:Membrane protein n=1 Tax=Catellatospora coxensis TaxID=310354 RepID=A0A8J3KVA9_9ACTN|nr:carotenoid biosynthesis protein [Catellatospora coxensis]GIG07760.1 membrane protein [Catellatospora coxensis]
MPPPDGRGRAVAITQWVLVAAGLTVALVMPLATSGAAPVVGLLLLAVPFAAIHGTCRYGWRRFLTFFAVSFVVSNFFENLSIMTGFPFGDYHYTGSVKLFHVPIEIGPIYFGLGYLSWLTASTLLDRADEQLNWRERTGRFNTFALPALAAAVMTMFDVSVDSQASTVNHVWIWEDGGGVFGVPYTNYLGWWLVTHIFFQIFALLLAGHQTRAEKPGAAVTPGSLLQPVLFYMATGLASVSMFFAAETGTVVDAAGVIWDRTAINETMMTIGVFSVITVALLALAKIARGDTRTPL